MYRISVKVDFGLIAFSLAAFIAFHILKNCSLTKNARLPGPRRLPIIGNALDMPTTRGWETFARWRKLYGGAVQFAVLGQDIVVLTSHEAIEVLMKQRSGISGDRLPMTLLSKWAGFGWVMAAQGYGSEMHRQRRLMNLCINPTATRAYEKCIRNTTLRFCDRLSKLNGANANKNDEVWRICERFTEENVMRIAYGYEVTQDPDPFIQIQRESGQLTSDLGALGTHPVDIFPSLSHLPKWIFGFEFSRKLNLLTKVAKEGYELPYADAKTRIRDGVDLKPSMVDTMIAHSTEQYGLIDNESSIEAVAGTVFNAGTHTIGSTLKTFILVMALNPNVQEKAQKCLDLVLDDRRLPDFRDRSNPALVYIEACLLECTRWRPALPLGVPHRLIADTVYEGIRLKKGTMLIGAVWAVMHDEELFPNPDVYQPERWLRPDGKSIRNEVPTSRELAFGFGRRICPGRHIAESTVWIAAATMLSLFTFSKGVNEDGSPVEPDLEYQFGLGISHPKHVPCNVEIRSHAAAELISASFERE